MESPRTHLEPSRWPPSTSPAWQSVLAEAFIVKQNEHEIELLLANLKARMEA